MLVLTEKLSVLYTTNPVLYKLCCYDVFKKMVCKQHPGYVEPRRETDKCSWCYQYKYEVTPRFEDALAAIVSKLESLFSEYFKFLKEHKLFKEKCKDPLQKCRMYTSTGMRLRRPRQHQ